jgi:hypothetical protein
MFGVSLHYVTGLGMLICWIIVLIHMFKASVLHGILGLICGLWAFIWGWMHAAGSLRNVMLIWTILLLLSLVLGFTVGWPGVPITR